ncbi:hypothetical protein RI367_006459 [Sorochytrium milnesiophthora]
MCNLSGQAKAAKQQAQSQSQSMQPLTQLPPNVRPQQLSDMASPMSVMTRGPPQPIAKEPSKLSGYSADAPAVISPAIPGVLAGSYNNNNYNNYNSGSSTTIGLGLNSALSSPYNGRPGVSSGVQLVLPSGATVANAQNYSGKTSAAATPLITNLQFVVGVDFGTTFSGFGIYKLPAPGAPASLTHDQILSKDDWSNQPAGIFSQKVPTVIAYNLDNGSRVWGWTAKRTSNERYRRVERFKLCLEPSTPAHLLPTLPDGKTAEDVVADYLFELRTAMMTTLRKRYPVEADSLTPDNVLYCFTVPVGWSNTAHESIRRAAARAGYVDRIDSNNLTFCYEPEAAALSCSHEANSAAGPGATMLVVDCGGGTVDLFQCGLSENTPQDNNHQGMFVGDLAEITVGTGEFLGATVVDSHFWNYVQDLIGPLAFDELKSSPDYRHQYNEMESKWESLKRGFEGPQTFELNPYDIISLPHSLYSSLTPVRQAALPRGEIRINLELMQTFFDPVVGKIIELSREQLRRAALEGRSTIDFCYIVGGFGCSAYLRNCITEDDFVRQHVRYPTTSNRPEAAVLLGAVWCGINHQNIKIRRARKTIGVGVWRVFDPSRDNESHVVQRKETDPMNPAFWFVPAVYVFVRKGQPVRFNDVYARSDFTVYSRHSRLASVNIFGTDRDVEVINDRIDQTECELLGTVSVDVETRPGPGAATSPISASFDSFSDANRPKFTIAIAYGKVELSVIVADAHTGREWTTILNHGHINIR